MKRFLFIVLSALMLLVQWSCTKGIEASVPARMVDGTIITDAPVRQDGQKTALQMTSEPIDTVRIAFVGVGMRGSSAVRRYTHMDGVKIVALCDVEQGQVDKNQKRLSDAGLPAAREYVGENSYLELCKSDDIDLVYISTDWMHHVPIAICAMENGKHAAIEVPSAMTLKDCWDLIDTSERTRRHCICLENCCYDFFEATCLNMAQHGLFGEVYHVEGAYIHNLAPYWKKYHELWRTEYNRLNRGDNYPTHGFGPIAQVLNLHRGDKMTTLVAMDTKSFMGIEYARRVLNDDSIDSYANGDHTISLINTEKGKLIEIQHNVYANRPYSRMYQLTGTNGFANKYPTEGILIEKDPFSHLHVNKGHEECLPKEQFDSLMLAYKPAFISEIEEKAKAVGGHGGMDYIMDYRLIYCLNNGLPMDIDVYDLAEWCCVQELSRISLENGSAPVQVPDFTRGDWNKINGFNYAYKK